MWPNFGYSTTVIVNVLSTMLRTLLKSGRENLIFSPNLAENMS